MTDGLSVSFLVPCKSVSIVKHRVLQSTARPVLHLSSPAPHARLVHVEIIEGRPFKSLLQRRKCRSSVQDLPGYQINVTSIQSKLILPSNVH
jgi:hypothetical protein